MMSELQLITRHCVHLPQPGIFNNKSRRQTSFFHYHTSLDCLINIGTLLNDQDWSWTVFRSNILLLELSISNMSWPSGQVHHTESSEWMYQYRSWNMSFCVRHINCFSPPRSKWDPARIEIAVVNDKWNVCWYGCRCCVLLRSWDGFRPG